MNSSTEKISEQRYLSIRYCEDALESIFQEVIADVALTPLAGDASARRYFRLTYRKKPQDRQKQSVVLMQLEKPEPKKKLDFALLSAFLRNLDLPAPETLYYDAKKGVLFLEDCGDTLFQDVVGPDKGLEEKRRWYQKAVELLAALQTRGARHIGPDCPAFHRRFDVEKLMWEFNFMLTHYVEGLKNRSIAARDLAHIQRSFEPLCATLAAQKLCFTHRDYHSRNLMVQKGQLKILDFQDARMGPSQYDLASLLRDSYVPLEETLVWEMVELFIQLKENADGQKISRPDFFSLFD
ncbi:MAG: aminoglycoside phosphotransferase family protein, partial [Nitrospinales bacterium]